MQPEEEHIPTREDIERGLHERGWKQRWVREGGPSVFERPEVTEDTGYCIVTDDHICMIDFPRPKATDWVPIADGLDFLAEKHPK